MYNIDFKNIRKGYGFGFTFFIVGLLFFIIMTYVVFGGTIKKLFLDSKTKAISIDTNEHVDSEGETMYSPIYYYKVGREKYSCKTYGSSNKKVSSKANMVYYDSKNPKNCTTDYEVKQSFFMYIFWAFPLLFVYVGFDHMLKVFKRVKNAKYLATNGQLIKNLPYQMENTNLSNNGGSLLAIGVDYKLETGSIIHLVGEPRFDRKQTDEDGLVDLLIDPKNPNNYYIDFNIERKH
ncbi:MAG TPA: hypothetical protein PLV83_00055 [Bacilli bacterium]|nr:hypothetical protein [Bacilli bacterium]